MKKIGEHLTIKEAAKMIGVSEEKSEILLEEIVMESLKTSEELTKQYLGISFNHLKKKKLETTDDDVQIIIDFYISISRFFVLMTERLMSNEETTKFVTKITLMCLRSMNESIEELLELKLKELHE